MSSVEFCLTREGSDNFGSPSVESMPPVEIIAKGIECKRLEVIPLECVITEDALIDSSHAAELGDSMRQKRGQITPIAVRARLDEEKGNLVYDIIDGFHRAEGRKQSGDTDINATVIYGCSDQELYDLRILAASSVRSVQYPRLVEWITRSWETTTWSKKGLNVTQAFGMAVSGAQRSNFIDLSLDEVREIKDWVTAKSQRWSRTVGTTYQMLRLVSNADPTLVRQVRIQSGGTHRIAQITPERLKLVVDQFPGEEHYPIQRALLRVTVDRRYFTEELDQLIERVKPLIKPGMTEEEIYRLAEEITVEETARYRRKTQKPEIPTGGSKPIPEKRLVEEGEKTDAGDWDKVEPDDEDGDLGELEPSDAELMVIEAASSQGASNTRCSAGSFGTRGKKIHSRTCCW